MTDENNQEVAYPITINGHTLMFPVPRDHFAQLSPEQQMAAYDYATATQIEWNDDNITTDADWIGAARVLYDRVNPESTASFRERWATLDGNGHGSGLSAGERAAMRSRLRQRTSSEMTDEELGEWLYDHMGELHGNLSGMLVSVQDATGNPELARALNIAMMRYENKSISGQGVGNVLEGVAQDPLTYVGITAATSAISKIVGRETISGAIRNRLGQILASGAAAGAIEGGAYTLADDAARQNLSIEAGTQDGFNWGRAGSATFFGVALGGAFGAVFGDAVGLSRRGQFNLASDAAQVVDGSVADDVAVSTVSDLPSIVPGAQTMDVYNDFIPQGLANDAGFSPVSGAGQGTAQARNLTSQIQQRIQGLIDRPTREGFFDVDTMVNAREAARYLRQYFVSDVPEMRDAARQAVLESKNAAPTMQTLLDDSVRLLEDLYEELDVAKALDDPDLDRIALLETQVSAEMARIVEFSELTSILGSEAGTQLRAIQASTADNLGIVQAIDEGNLNAQFENIRLATLRAADSEAVDDAVAPGSNGFLNWMRESNIVKAAVELQRNALLSGPATFVTNFLGPVINYSTEFVEEVIGAVGTRFKDEASEMAWGRLQGMTRQMGTSLDIAWRAMREHRVVTGVDFIDGESVSTRAISSEGFGMNPNSFGGSLVDFAGQSVRLVDGVQLLSDGFLSSRIAISEVYAQARSKGRARGLSGEELQRFIANQIDRTFDPETGRIRNTELLHDNERLMMRARPPRNNADRTLTDKIIRAGEQAYRHVPITRLLQPFWRTPMRLLQAGGRRLPVIQQFSQSFRRDLSGQNGYRAYVRARGQFITAQSLAAITSILTIQGVMRGEPHSSRDYRIAAEGQDLDANFSIGGFVVDRLDPISTPLRTISMITEEMMYVAHQGNEERYEDLSDQMMSATAALLQTLSASTVEQTMLQGFEDIFQALNTATDPDNPDLESALGRWFAQRATTFYPNLLKKVEDLQDPTREVGVDFASSLLASTGLADTMRTLDGWNEAFGADLVTKRRNILGELVEIDAMRATFGIVSDERSDPLREELQEAMETTGVFLNPIRYRLADANNMDVRMHMTDDGETTIYDRWQENLQNVGLRDALTEVIATPEYQEGTYGRRGRPGRRLRLLQDTFSTYRTAAWQMTLQQNEQFTRQYLLERRDEDLRSLR